MVLYRGGLPEAIQTFIEHRENLFQAFEKVREKQMQLISDYYADIAKHSGKVNAMHIDRVWRSIPTQLAKSTDGSSKKFQFNGIIEGIDRYNRLANVFDWLDNAGLILKVPVINHVEQPLSSQTIESHFKLFVFDVGILGALSNLAPRTILEYDYGTYKGYFGENFVTQEFFSGNHKDLFSWQEGRTEVEFLRNVEGYILPIEVKSGPVRRAKSLQRYVEKFSPKYRTIMSGRPFKIDLTNHVHCYPLYLASQFPIVHPDQE